MILPGLIGHFIFLWGWLFSIFFFFFAVFFNQRLCPRSYILRFMAAGLPPSLSALHAELTVSCGSVGAAGMVSVLTFGGGGGGGGREGVEAKANAGDLGLEGERWGSAVSVRTDGIHVSRGSQKGKDRLCSPPSHLLFFFKSPQRMTIYTTLTDEQQPFCPFVTRCNLASF